MISRTKSLDVLSLNWQRKNYVFFSFKVLFIVILWFGTCIDIHGDGAQINKPYEHSCV